MIVERIKVKMSEGVTSEDQVVMTGGMAPALMTAPLLRVVDRDRATVLETRRALDALGRVSRR